MQTRHSLSSLAFCLSALAPSLAAQGLLSQGQTLLSDGDPVAAVPGATIGNTSSIDSAMIDLDGNVLVRARMTGGGVGATTDRAYFLGRTRETMQMILQSGAADPTGGLLGAGTTLNTATGTGLSGSPRLSPRNGYVMFGCSLSGPSIVTTGTAAAGNNSTAILWGQPAALQVLARRGDFFTTATNQQTYQFDSSFSAPSHQTTCLNENGIATFQSTVIGGDVVGTTNNLGWLIGTPGNLDWVIRKNDIVSIPGGNNPGVFAIHTALGFNCALNVLGQAVHDERLLSTGTPPAGASLATTTNDNCIFLYTGGVNQLIVREGDQAAGMPAGALYGSPTISQGFGLTGQIGFACTMTGAVTTSDDSAYFIGTPGLVQNVMREGDPAPGLPGVVFGVPNSNSSYSDYQGGSIAFYAALADAGAGVTAFNDTSLWLGRPGNLQLIAREGDPAPGFEGRTGFVSATFGNATTGASGITAGSVQLNELGHINFSNVAVTIVDAAGTSTITTSYAWDPQHGLRPLFAPGDEFATVSGPVAGNSAGGLQFPSGDGCPLSLNNQGDVVQRVSLTSGSALARAHLGSNNCLPSAIAGTTGGVHTMDLDAGAANANSVYIVLCGGAGSRPGFFFGGSQISLNLDPVWTDFGFANLNSGPWAGTFGLLDQDGRASASFTVPVGTLLFAPQDLRHVLTVVDLATLAVPFAGEPCSLLLY